MGKDREDLMEAQSRLLGKRAPKIWSSDHGLTSKGVECTEGCWQQWPLDYVPLIASKTIRSRRHWKAL